MWETLLRYDLRYSEYTSDASHGNAGELVLQLLTEMVRNRCTEEPPSRRRSSSSLRGPVAGLMRGASRQPSAAAAPMVDRSSFVRGEQGRIWNLPVFDDTTSSIRSGAPFELVSSVVQFAGLSAASGVAAAAGADMKSSLSVPGGERQRLVVFCLRFLDEARNDDVRSTFLPFMGTCLAALIGGDNGVITIGIPASTFDLDNLTSFATTEDTEPLRHFDDHAYSYVASGDDESNESMLQKRCLSSIHDGLWADAMNPNDHDVRATSDAGLARRILEGRGARLSAPGGGDDATFDRERLRRHTRESQNRRSSSSSSSRESTSTSLLSDGFSQKALAALGKIAMEKIEECLEAALSKNRADIENSIQDDDSDNDAMDDASISNAATIAIHAESRALSLPYVTSCLSLTLSVLLSQSSSAEDVAAEIERTSSKLFFPALDEVSAAFLSLSGGEVHVEPPLLLRTVANLRGIFRVLTHVAAIGEGSPACAAIPKLFVSRTRTLFARC